MFLKRKQFMIVIITILVLGLSACGKATATQDPNQKITEIASTVQAELTKISALTPQATLTFTPTATETPAPATPTVDPASFTATNTALPTSSGPSADNAAFVADVNMFDGTMVLPGSTFEKTWTIRNNGSTTWTTAYQLVYLEGIAGQNNTYAVNLPNAVAPGEQVNISVTFTAPLEVGSYISYWKMYSASGYVFGEQVNVKFSVGTTSATPTTSASGSVTPTLGTSTPTSTPTTTSTSDPSSPG